MLKFSIGRKTPLRSWKYLRSGTITTFTAILLSDANCVPEIYHTGMSFGSGFGVKVVASEWNVRMTLRVGLRQQSLNDVDPRRCERVRRCGHVESPDTEGVISHQRHRIATLLLERFHPVPQRHRVVLAQTLDIPYLESRRFSCRDHIVGSCELPIGKDVGVDERVRLPELLEDSFAHRFRPSFSEADDAMIQKQSTGA